MSPAQALITSSPSGPSPLVEPGFPNVWRVTCHCILARPRARLSLSLTSLRQKWLLLHLSHLAASSDHRMDVVTGRDANLLTISVQRPEREPHRNRLGETHSLHPPLPHPGPDREGMVTPRRETLATFIGIPVSATVGLNAHSATKRTLPHDLVPPTLPVESETRKTLQMQLWNFSR